MTRSLPINDLPTVDLAGAIREGSISAVQACETYLGRIAAVDGALNAYASVFADSARSAAAAADEILARGGVAGPLHGVPIAVKDLVAIAGRTTLAGSRLREGDPPAQEDAIALSRLRAAGAILLGTLTMDEFAAGLTTEHTWGDPTRNPWDPDRVAGGSSGGSAVAVAAGLASATVGSDTNGSIRVPAAFCGGVGFKPTYGRIPMTGVTPLSWSLDHLGPMARTAGDARLIYEVMRDPSGDADDPIEIAADLRGLRVGLLPSAHLDACSPSVRAAYEDAVESIVPNVVVVEVDPSALDWSRAASGIVTAAEAATYHLADLRARPEAFHPGIRDDLRAAALLPATAYVQAQRVRAEVRDRFAEMFESVDVLLVPTTLEQALTRGDADGRSRLGHFTQPFSFAGIPAISVPLLQAAEGLPVGLTVAGPAYRDDRVLSVAAALETLGVVRTLVPDRPTPSSDPVVA